LAKTREGTPPSEKSGLRADRNPRRISFRHDEAGDQRKPNKVGRPPFVPTKEQRSMVERLAGLLVARDDIADLLGISHVTLRKALPRRAGPRQAPDRRPSEKFDAASSSSRRGNVRACAWLLDRLGPEFSMPAWRGKSQGSYEIPASGATVIIRGGLPAPEAEPPMQNGEDRE
jgi:hypothetical protein